MAHRAGQGLWTVALCWTSVPLCLLLHRVSHRPHSTLLNPFTQVLEEYLEKAKSLREDVKCTAHLIAGDPRDELIAAATKWHASALVVGSRGRGAIKRALLGSVSSYLAQHSAVPVVIVHHNA